MILDWKEGAAIVPVTKEVELGAGTLPLVKDDDMFAAAGTKLIRDWEGSGRGGTVSAAFDFALALAFDGELMVEVEEACEVVSIESPLATALG